MGRGDGYRVIIWKAWPYIIVGNVFGEYHPCKLQTSFLDSEKEWVYCSYYKGWFCRPNSILFQYQSKVVAPIGPSHHHFYMQSNLYIKATQGNLKMWPLWALSFIYRLKLHALFINGENEPVFYRQWFVI